MKSFSTKSRVEQLDIEVDGSPVFVRQLTAGDKIKLSETQGQLAAAAAGIRDKAQSVDVEEIGAVASASLSPDQYKAWVSYMYEYVFLRWSNSDGKRRYTDRKAFNDLPSEMIEAIYVESAKIDGEASAEEAEKNS